MVHSHWVKYHFFKIAVVSECTIKRLGYLPSNMDVGTCGSFIINGLPTTILCYDKKYKGERFPSTTCRSLTRKNDGALSEIKDFIFESEFEIDRFPIPNPTSRHTHATMANYRGSPLLLGGGVCATPEMFNAIGNPPRWVTGPDYPYSFQ